LGLGQGKGDEQGGKKRGNRQEKQVSPLRAITIMEKSKMYWYGKLKKSGMKEKGRDVGTQ